MATQEKELVIKAINDLGRRVTAADVATKTGLPILKTTVELNKIAAETNGHLQVGTAGDIAYGFDAGFQNTYLAKGFEEVVQRVGHQVFNVGYFLLRISFGIMLVVSFLFIVVLIIAVMLSQSKDSDSDSGGGFSFDFFDYMLLRDIFWWSSYPSYNTYGTLDYDRPYELYDRQQRAAAKTTIF